MQNASKRLFGELSWGVIARLQMQEERLEFSFQEWLHQHGCACRPLPARQSSLVLTKLRLSVNTHRETWKHKATQKPPRSVESEALQGKPG